MPVSKKITKDPNTFKSEIQLRYTTAADDLEALEVKEFVEEATKAGATVAVSKTDQTDGTTLVKITYTPA